MPGRKKLWRAYAANEITHSGAHYLLAIAALSKEGGPPRATNVARHLGVSRAAVSLQLHGLQDHHLVRIHADQRLHLTRSGADLVARIAGKREVVRVFLRDVLGVDPTVAELDACKIEHLLSEQTGAALVQLIQLLRAAHPAARAFIETYRSATASCPGDRRCELCHRVCLLRAGGAA